MMMDKSDGTREPIERKITIVMGRSHSHRGTNACKKRLPSTTADDDAALNAAMGSMPRTRRVFPHRGTTHRHKRAAHQVEADVSGCVYAHDHAHGQEHGLEQQPFHAASRPPIRV